MDSRRIIEAAKRSTKNQSVLRRLEDINWALAYAEPGYSQPKSGRIYFADWNDITEYDSATGERKVLDRTMGRVAELLERSGAAIEWLDEWARCALCGKAVRTQPNSYSWQPSYFLDDEEGEICLECVEQDPKPYMESLEGQAERAWTLDIDPAKHGYRLVKNGLESGWYPGQNAEPKKIAAELESRGIERFLFRVDSVGQFDVLFSVYEKTTGGQEGED